jgi:hypothetical protein
MGIHATEPPVPGSSPLEVDIALAKLKSVNDQRVINFRLNKFKSRSETI